MTVICSKCFVVKPDTEFHKSRQVKSGHRPDCKTCRRVHAIAVYAADPGKSKRRAVAWAREHIDRTRATSRRSNAKHIDKRRAESRAWQGANKSKDAERSAFQRAALRRATPIWADRCLIRDIYRLAQIATECLPWAAHVDHIVPLTSDVVQGLHVEHNLTVLLAEENLRKKNRFGEEPSLS